MQGKKPKRIQCYISDEAAGLVPYINNNKMSAVINLLLSAYLADPDRFPQVTKFIDPEFWETRTRPTTTATQLHGQINIDEIIDTLMPKLVKRLADQQTPKQQQEQEPEPEPESETEQQQQEQEQEPEQQPEQQQPRKPRVSSAPMIK